MCVGVLCVLIGIGDNLFCVRKMRPYLLLLLRAGDQAAKLRDLIDRASENLNMQDRVAAQVRGRIFGKHAHAGVLRMQPHGHGCT